MHFSFRVLSFQRVQKVECSMNGFEILIKTFIQLIANVMVGVMTFSVTVVLVLGFWELAKRIVRTILIRGSHED